jgi:hypothetical protein
MCDQLSVAVSICDDCLSSIWSSKSRVIGKFEHAGWFIVISASISAFFIPLISILSQIHVIETEGIVVISKAPSISGEGMSLVAHTRRSSSVKINPTFASSLSVSGHSPRPGAIYPADRAQYELLFLCGTHLPAEFYVARCLTNDCQVCAKLIDLDSCDLDVDELCRPIELWQMNAHPNMLSYYTSFVHDAFCGASRSIWREGQSPI